MDIVSATILLVLVMDPFGNMPLVISVLKHVAAPKRAKVVLRECAIAYAVLLAFMFGGDKFMHLLRLSDNALAIAGGLILFLIALRMVFPHADGVHGDTGDTGTFIVPLAIPAIAGPSALATVLLLVSREPQRMFDWVAALSIAMLVSTLVMISAQRISDWIGKRGVIALERLMGLVLTAIAVEMLLAGVERFIVQLPR
ncbi:MAG: MarC family protein [Betaproteobacteria bacterium]|nr:MarC family protein [Betaproteobacteria bacterium]